MSLFETLRKPEHTGDARCWPCTAVNSAFVLGLAGVVGRRWKPAGVAVLLFGAAAIALRGYVVPYTPQFAPRLVEPLPVDFKTDEPRSDSFSTVTVERAGDGETVDETDETDETDAEEADTADDEPETPPDSDSLTALDADGAQVMGALLEAGIIVDDGEMVVPTDEFVEAWESTMAELRGLDDAAFAAAVADAAPFEAEGAVDDGWVVVEGQGQAVHLTRAIAIAETAAIRVMADHDVPESVRVDAAQPLRMFLEHCPKCGGVVEETTTAACCGGSKGAYGGVVYDVLACSECETIVYEFDETVED
ncbi:hypothetical protein SAMN04487949_1643 [Halogranum gelatinilyticum]|uniref:Uncharacterized protein n=1 Tax=Halogranum gelatinilyticum TaxID=660521 RepID=A0A1G9T6M2_9EURY|nr:hypothetical protein [Halogranum gelatinilyticum]SDM43379.1 hypothetical protein SAMN04487949_1643 [Halogranum gelatinilyticum]